MSLVHMTDTGRDLKQHCGSPFRYRITIRYSLSQPWQQRQNTWDSPQRSQLRMNPPFAFARRASTLDHLTKGRFGWNIVTSYLPNAARNFGWEKEVAHGQRYDRADEYLDVLYKLWEGSWDDDAVIQDRENYVYTDPDKVRYIHHRGEH